jgi:hypothetical protein
MIFVRDIMNITHISRINMAFIYEAFNFFVCVKNRINYFSQEICYSQCKPQLLSKYSCVTFLYWMECLLQKITENTTKA